MYTFLDIHQVSRSRPPIPSSYPSVGQTGTAFQAYQPGVTYQPTSQFPVDQIKPHSTSYSRSAAPGYQPGGGNFPPPDPPARNAAHPPPPSAQYHDNELIDTADESDVVSIKPSKSRSGNTFTVKKVSSRQISILLSSSFSMVVYYNCNIGIRFNIKRIINFE